MHELNFTIQKEGKHKTVKKGNDGIHRLEATKPLSMIFYKNGVHLEGFPMFYFGSHDALSLIADLLDGYFPRQLEKSHPDGVLLQVIDKLDEMKDEKKQAGGGIPIAGIGKNEVPTEMKPISKEEFLKKLPEKVIREGKIIEIRKGVESSLSNPNPTGGKTESKLKGVVKDENGSWIVQNEYLLDEKYKSVQDDICLLKVKLEFLGESLLLHILKTCSLSDVLNSLLKCLHPSVKQNKKYKLVNGFPRTDLDTSTPLTIEELGLHPRAAIFLCESI